MERALEREGGRVLAVLESAVRSLELLAIVPSSGRKPPFVASTDAALSSDTRRTITRHVRALASPLSGLLVLMVAVALHSSRSSTRC